MRSGVVHLGLGAFHRAHQAAVFDTVLAAGDPRWGVTGVSLRGTTAFDQLAAQNGLYTLVERSGEQEAARVMGAIVRVLPPGNAASVVAALASPDTAIVTLTVTEKGYSPGEPAPRLIAEALALRREHGLPAFTAISCDNLPHNGETLRAAVLASADGETARWIADHATFPNAMVDRIVPATTAEDLAAVTGLLGLADRGAVVTEPYLQWVIEDRFAGPRPDLEAAGVQLTDDVAAWETTKLRLLNGAHSAMAYLGQLMDIDVVHRFVADAGRRGFVERLWDESATTIAAPAGLDLLDYRRRLMERFRNAALPHRTAQIAVDGTQKLPQRLVRPFVERARGGQQSPALAAAIAGWAAWAASAAAVSHLADPQAVLLREVAAAHGPIGLLELLDPSLQPHRAPIDAALAIIAISGAQRTIG